MVVALPLRARIDLDGVMAAWARREARPRLLLSDDLAVIWGDPRIDAIPLGEYGLSLRGGRLSGTSVRARQLLRDFLASLDSQLSVATFADEEGGSLILRGRRVEHEGRRLLGFELECEGDDSSYCYVGVRAAFGLTIAEERVVQRLLDGRCAMMVANDLEISLDTARTHIRQAYAKIGANCREALFHRLRAYRAG